MFLCRSDSIGHRDRHVELLATASALESERNSLFCRENVRKRERAIARLDMHYDTCTLRYNRPPLRHLAASPGNIYSLGIGIVTTARNGEK